MILSFVACRNESPESVAKSIDNAHFNEKLANIRRIHRRYNYYMFSVYDNLTDSTYSFCFSTEKDTRFYYKGDFYKNSTIGLTSVGTDDLLDICSFLDTTIIESVFNHRDVIFYLTRSFNLYYITDDSTTKRAKGNSNNDLWRVGSLNLYGNWYYEYK